MKKASLIILFIVCLLLAGCQSADLADVRVQETAVPTATPKPLPTIDPKAEWQEKLEYYKTAEEREGLAVAFSVDNGFYKQNITVELSAEGATDIFYTDDGSEPGPQSLHYTHSISLAATNAELPRCAVIRAVAYYGNGTKSPCATRVYFLNSNIFKRFSTLVFSIVAPPAELNDGPLALLVGKRALDTGENAKRTVLLQVYEKNGTEIINQPAILRVYGGDSRSMAVKSLQLTPIAENEGEEAAFIYPFFDTVSAKANTIDHYSQLVLSNGEDDFQYAFIRDELAAKAARLAGFPDFEECQPAVVYLNGEYYGLHWLHDVYGDAYFHRLYDVSTGYYAVIDWDEKNGATPLEEGAREAAQAFQERYRQLVDLDLTKKENIDQMADLIDVENYLNYCALNIYLNNENWPSQMRMYTYIPEGGDVQEAIWRCLPHDMDRSFGLKGGKNGYAVDTLGLALTPGNARYSKLFAKLMERKECRAYFLETMTELLEDAFSFDSMLSAMKELNGVRKTELQHYFTRLEKLRKVRNSTIWMKSSDYDSAYKELATYIEKRPDAVKKALETHYPKKKPAVIKNTDRRRVYLDET